MNKEIIKKLIVISRPLGWMIGPFLLALGVIYAEVPFTPVIILQALTYTFPMSFVTFGLNDVYDYESDKKNPAKESKVIASGALADMKMTHLVWKVALAMICLTIVISMLSGNIYNVILTIVVIGLVMAYSIPPIRLKTRPILDSISNGLIIMLPLVMGYSYIGNFKDIPMLKFVVIAIAAMCTHAILAVRDIDFDLSVGDKTVATFLGRTNTMRICALIFFGLCLLQAFDTWFLNGYLLFFSILTALLSSRETFIKKYLKIYGGILLITFYIAAIAWIVF